jgi:hypothetical protein
LPSYSRAIVPYYLQVAVGGGGQNILNSTSSTLNMTYEHFLQQVNLGTINIKSSGFGVSTGLINQGYWSQVNGILYVERGNIADKLQPRNINFSFIINRNVALIY